MPVGVVERLTLGLWAKRTAKLLLWYVRRHGGQRTLVLVRPTVHRPWNASIASAASSRRSSRNAAHRDACVGTGILRNADYSRTAANRRVYVGMGILQHADYPHTDAIRRVCVGMRILVRRHSGYGPECVRVCHSLASGCRAPVGNSVDASVVPVGGCGASRTRP